MIADDSVVRDPRNAKSPLVSVLVPSYNHEKYVIECLESIKGLSYPRLELILSDDGSLTIAKAGIMQFEFLDKARIIDGQDAWGPMALADGYLLMRDSKQMVCINVKAK